MELITSAGLAFAVLSAFATSQRCQTGLNFNAQLSGRYYGTATGSPKFQDNAYMSILNDTKEVGRITTENEFKWGRTQPLQGVWDYSEAHKVVDVAIANEQPVRAHCLIWHIEQPAWLEQGAWTPDELGSLMEIHINKSVIPFAGKIEVWDVVNEVIADNPRGEMRKSFWYNILGEEYIDMAFHYTHAADPDAELWINDYWQEAPGPKADGYYDLITRLLGRGVPIHGVGFQCHFPVGGVPEYEDLKQNMQRFADLGLTIAITEIDIRVTLPVTDEQLEQQAKDYATLTKVCMDINGCDGITVWDFSDTWNWVPEGSGLGAAALWDVNYKKKPSYHATVHELRKAEDATLQGSE